MSDFKITGYVTAFANSAKELDEEVNKLIMEGYQPYGSPYLTDSDLEGKTDTFVLFQAMTITAEG